MFKKCRLFLVAFLVSLFLPLLPSAYAAHDDFVVVGDETLGAMRGPLFQIYGVDGTFRLGKFVLGPTFSNNGTYVIIGDVLNGADPGTPGANHERKPSHAGARERAPGDGPKKGRMPSARST